mmetsp:Transcript_18692/g.20927  ORF Transcript_18692/g.20927 Transcript_18692/m.20927 type:complete len:204 (+) Transcript_18692:140-751(+)|eukprot:CAMPEP_0170787016 /NCGR_PEP_ID=MMETSP0733-20121128/18045_1 /TAXON_ID=186038 /ORGANISM="Fragilariopsis kerguelensis, Strain L26-C5" /LENGTH=203 /DNA_ID=CAMNT_0011133169 /DNA_START=140 /DNA_END=751 /DNA_ORIENTATION=+
MTTTTTTPSDCVHKARTAEITYKVAWQKNDVQINEDAINIWIEMGAIKAKSQGVPRAKMLCVVAYDGKKLVAVSTIGVYPQEQTMVKGSHFRCVVRPAYRKRNIATELALRCLHTTEEWSKENPSFKVMNFTITIETQALFPKCRKPTWHGLVNFIGYTEQGLPVYVYWYKHAYIGDEQDPDYSFYPSGAPGASPVGMLQNGM